MRTNRRQYIQTLAGGAAVGTLGLAGCLGDDNSTAELWHDKADWEDAYNEILPLFPELTENGIEVTQTPYGSTDGFQGALRPVLGEGGGPALFTWWVGARLLDLADDDYAYDVTDQWQKYVDEGAYTEEEIDLFGADGNAYSVPSYTGYWAVWYKTETFEEHGFEPPSTWDEFEQLCDDMLQQEMRPITAFLDSSWYGFTWWAELVIGQDPSFYDALCAGDASYTDEISQNSMEINAEMVRQGYFGDNPSELFQLEGEDCARELEQGDAGMLLCGDWFSAIIEGVDLDLADYDWFAFPSVAEEGESYVVVEPAPTIIHEGYGDEETRDQLADAMLSAEFQEAWCSEQNFISPNSNIDTDYLPESKAKMVEEFGGEEYGLSLRYFENAAPEVADDVANTLTEIWSDPDNVEEIAQRAEDIRADVHD